MLINDMPFLLLGLIDMVFCPTYSPVESFY